MTDDVNSRPIPSQTYLIKNYWSRHYKQLCKGTSWATNTLNRGISESIVMVVSIKHPEIILHFLLSWEDKTVSVCVCVLQTGLWGLPSCGSFLCHQQRKFIAEAVVSCPFSK